MASKSDIATAPIPRDVIRRRVLPADALAHTRPDLPVYDLAAIPARELAPKKTP